MKRLFSCCLVPFVLCVPYREPPCARAGVLVGRLGLGRVPACDPCLTHPSSGLAMEISLWDYPRGANLQKKHGNIDHKTPKVLDVVYIIRRLNSCYPSFITDRR